MKMNKLRLIGASAVDLPLAGLDASGPFMLKSVDGLGPPDITVRMARTNQERASYQGKGGNLRQLTAVIALQPNWDEDQKPDDLRETLYALLSPRGGQFIRAEIVYNDVVQGYVQGQISKMEPTIFSSDPAVVLTLDCDYPYIVAPASVLQDPVVTLDGYLQKMDVENPGNAPSGFKTTFVIEENLPDPYWIMLSDSGTPVAQFLTVVGVPFMAGDKFIVDTRPGPNKGVWRTPAGTSFKNTLLNNLSGNVSWMTLWPGTTTITILTTGTVPVSIDPAARFEHTPAYWGV